MMRRGTCAAEVAAPAPESHRGLQAQYEVGVELRNQYRSSGAGEDAARVPLQAATDHAPSPPAAPARAGAAQLQFDERNDYTVAPMDLQRCDIRAACRSRANMLGGQCGQLLVQGHALGIAEFHCRLLQQGWYAFICCAWCSAHRSVCLVPAPK